MSTSPKSAVKHKATPQEDIKKAVRVVRPQNLPTIYVEGVSQLMLGFPTSRVQLFNAVDQENDANAPFEVHHHACELIIPTPALAELCITILKQMTTYKDLIGTSRAEWQVRVDAVFEQLNNLSAGQAASAGTNT